MAYASFPFEVFLWLHAPKVLKLQEDQQSPSPALLELDVRGWTLRIKNYKIIAKKNFKNKTGVIRESDIWEKTSNFQIPSSWRSKNVKALPVPTHTISRCYWEGPKHITYCLNGRIPSSSQGTSHVIILDAFSPVKPIWVNCF